MKIVQSILHKIWRYWTRLVIIFDPSVMGFQEIDHMGRLLTPGKQNLRVQFLLSHHLRNGSQGIPSHITKKPLNDAFFINAREITNLGLKT